MIFRVVHEEVVLVETDEATAYWSALRVLWMTPRRSRNPHRHIRREAWGGSLDCITCGVFQREPAVQLQCDAEDGERAIASPASFFY